MTNLTSIDAGTRCIGFGVWASSSLTLCGRSTAPASLKDYRDMLAYHEDNLSGYLQDQVVVEVMTHRYGKGRKKVDPNDLLRINVIAGSLGTVFVEPSEWKGGIKREMEQARTWAALTKEEKLLLPKTLAEIRKHPYSLDHNVFSAVGIGLSVLERAHLKCGLRIVKT